MFRGVMVWLVIMAAETVHGILRGWLLVPRVGAEAANRIGWPIGAVIVIGGALLFARWIGLRETSALLRLGLVWAALSLAFELGIGLLRGLGLPGLMAELDPARGGLLLYGLAVMAVAPLAAARLRRL